MVGFRTSLHDNQRAFSDKHINNHLIFKHPFLAKSTLTPSPSPIRKRLGGIR